MLNKKQEQFEKEEPQIVDEEQGYQDLSLTPKQIVLQHINRISKFIFSGEHEPTTKISGEGIVKTQDRRVIIIQAIDFLIAVLSTHYDEKMQTAQAKFEEVMEKVEKNLIDSAINTEAYHQALERTGDLQDTIKIFITLLKQNSIITIDKESSYYERYLTVKYTNYMKLFQEQNSLLNRIDYLGGSLGGEEE